MTAPKPASAILREAKALIDKPEKWTRGAYCRSANGVAAGFGDDSVVCRCAWGAIISASRGNADGEDRAWRYLSDVVGSVGVVEWNDAPNRTHADVMNAFDAAIALAERDEAAQ